MLSTRPRSRRMSGCQLNTVGSSRAPNRPAPSPGPRPAAGSRSAPWPKSVLTASRTDDRLTPKRSAKLPPRWVANRPGALWTAEDHSGQSADDMVMHLGGAVGRAGGGSRGRPRARRPVTHPVEWPSPRHLPPSRVHPRTGLRRKSSPDMVRNAPSCQYGATESPRQRLPEHRPPAWDPVIADHTDRNRDPYDFRAPIDPGLDAGRRSLLVRITETRAFPAPQDNPLSRRHRLSSGPGPQWQARQPALHPLPAFARRHPARPSCIAG